MDNDFCGQHAVAFLPQGKLLVKQSYTATQGYNVPKNREIQERERGGGLYIYIIQPSLNRPEHGGNDDAEYNRTSHRANRDLLDCGSGSLSWMDIRKAEIRGVAVNILSHVRP